MHGRPALGGFYRRRQGVVDHGLGLGYTLRYYSSTGLSVVRRVDSRLFYYKVVSDEKTSAWSLRYLRFATLPLRTTKRLGIGKLLPALTCSL